MTTKNKTTDDIIVASRSAGATQQEIRAFKRKNAWVVDTQRSAALRYGTILGNLACDYAESETATIDTVRDALRRGLSRTAFERLKAVIGVSSEELCVTIGIPSRTLARRVRFRPDESERILRVASAFQRALEVIGALDKARRWFTTPKKALGDKTPLEFCDTEPGAVEVEHLLGRIEHGVFT